MVLLQPHHDGIDRFEIRSDTLDTYKHSSLEEYRQQLAEDTFANVFKFTCIRNPWDRCVSFFFSPHRGPVEWSPAAFEDFIRTTVEPHSSYLRLDGRSGDPFDNLDAVLRFEHLIDDFALICDRLGLGRHELPVANASSRNHYKSYYSNDRLIELVAEKFAPEIARFRYEF
jgi:hypothetical protein